MEPFNSVMPAWKDVLDEQARWDVINYMQALGTGQVRPRTGMGGARFDPAAEAAQHAQMLTQGIEQGVITADEADIFEQVHAAMDNYRGMGRRGNFTGTMMDMRDMMLAEVVTDGTITQSKANAFVDILDRLIEADLMQYFLRWGFKQN